MNDHPGNADLMLTLFVRFIVTEAGVIQFIEIMIKKKAVPGTVYRNDLGRAFFFGYTIVYHPTGHGLVGIRLGYHFVKGFFACQKILSLVGELTDSHRVTVQVNERKRNK